VRLASFGMSWAGGVVIVLLWAPRASACAPVYLSAVRGAIECDRISQFEQVIASASSIALVPDLQKAIHIEPPVAPAQPDSRPISLAPLYASFVTLQALDAHSTISAARAGAREQNPVVAPIVGSPFAVVALKAATTTGAIVLTEKLWRRHRIAAIALMIGVNGAYAAIVAHNYRVGR
jgi:hypothetical protein